SGLSGEPAMNGNIGFATIRNAAAVPSRDVPELPLDDFRRAIIDAVAAGGRVAAVLGHHDEATNGVEIYAVVGDSMRARLHVGKTRLMDNRYEAMTPECPQVHLFERELAEQYGVRPE